MDFTEDLDVFFATFGIAVIVGTDTVAGIFDEPGKSSSSLTGMVYNTAPVCTVRQSDVDGLGIEAGTILSIGEADYSVVEIATAGPGLMRLMLTTDF